MMRAWDEVRTRQRPHRPSAKFARTGWIHARGKVAGLKSRRKGTDRGRGARFANVSLHNATSRTRKPARQGMARALRCLTPRAKGTPGKSMKNLFRALSYFRADAWQIALTVVLLLLSIGLNVLKPWPLALVVDCV